ncbi:MAG: VOC family protein [Gammaproteobacteria bacterium]|nr:VOC family protein [Gammaproteobacteria bacterium]
MSNNVITNLHHVSLIVEDLNIALAFYQEVLGLEIDKARPDLGYPGAWLLLPAQQQLHLMQLDDPDKNSERPEHGGRDRHVAFTVNSINYIAASLDSLGIPYTKSRSGRKALFCRDPDGNALEFIES